MIEKTQDLDVVLKTKELQEDGYVSINDTYKLLIVEYRRLKQIIDEHNEQLDAIKERMKSLLGDSKGVYNSKGEVLVTYTKIIRKSFDSNRFKKYDEKLYNSFLKESEIERLTFK